MRYLLKRGNGALRRVVHLCRYNQVTGKPIMEPICGPHQRSALRYDEQRSVGPPRV